MRILFLTDNFPPEVNAPASRTFEHCREWVQQGVQVTVITCAPNFPQGKVYEGYQNKLYQKEVIEGITVIRVWSYITANEGDSRAYTGYSEEIRVNSASYVLDPTAFPSLLRMENEIVGFCARHLGGGPEAAGSFTSGGTESLILAVKTARDWARVNRPQVTRPEVIVPVTAHASLHKAAHYLDVTLVSAPVDPHTFKADVAAMRAAITDNTILLTASAASYAHGVIDPIAEIGQLALARGLLLHVDGCIGAFLLPYFRRLGAEEIGRAHV